MRATLALNGLIHLNLRNIRSEVWRQQKASITFSKVFQGGLKIFGLIFCPYIRLGKKAVYSRCSSVFIVDVEQGLVHSVLSNGNKN